MGNEKGAIYPIVIIIAAVFLSFTLFVIEGYVSDKKFYKESEEKLILEQLIRLAAKDLTAQLDLAGSIEANDGILFYPRGDVYFEMNKLDDRVIKVLLYGSSKDERKTQSLFLYDTTQKKVIKWIEK